MITNYNDAHQEAVVVDVIIVGAGAAGLAAGQELRQRGVSFRLIEARFTRGGRAQTDIHTLAFPVDLGCHWLHSPAQNLFRDKAVEFGALVKTDGQDSFLARNGQILRDREALAAQEFVSDCFICLKQARELEADLSVADFLDLRDNAWWPHFERCFLSKQATRAEFASAKDFGAYIWEGDDWPVLDGLGALVNRVGGDVPVTLNTPVRRIALTRDGVQVEAAGGKMDARAVIVTVSTSVLAGGAIAFDELPTETLAAIEGLPLGSANKVALRFNRDVFGTADSSMLMADLAYGDQIEFVLQPGGYNGVVALICGPFSLGLGRLGPKAMVDFTVSRLVEIFGPAVESALLPGELVINWDAEDWIGGGWSSARVGAATSRNQLGVPVEDRIFFAGEAVSLEYAGDVHGAHLSGVVAARKVVSTIKGTGSTRQPGGAAK